MSGMSEVQRAIFERDLLAEALGKIINASGISDAKEMTGPQLLLLAEDLEKSLREQNPKEEPLQWIGSLEIEIPNKRKDQYLTVRCGECHKTFKVKRNSHLHKHPSHHDNCTQAGR